MTGDLKICSLLLVKLKSQFITQLVGSLVAIFLNVGLFTFFTSASWLIDFMRITGGDSENPGSWTTSFSLTSLGVR